MDISYKDFSNICRLCLSEHDFNTFVLEESDFQMLKRFGVQVEVKEFDNLPQNICSQCQKKITSISAFINQCKTSFVILTSILLDENKRNCGIKLFPDIGDVPDDYKQNVEITHQETDKDIHSRNNGDSNLLKSEIIIKEDSEEDSNHKHLAQDNIIKVPTRQAEIICKTCNLIFKSKICLDKHYTKSNHCRPFSFKLYKCQYCCKEFLNSRDKTEHENVHTGLTPYNCQYCLKKFKFKTNLHTHIYRHKRKLGLIENKGSYTEKRVRLKLRCEKCEKTFASRSGFKSHQLKHEGKALKKNEVRHDKNIKHFLCNFCAMSFYMKANLDAHLRVHTGERPYKCSQCDQQFKQKSVLNRHTLSHLDVRPKPFVCDVCQKSFTTNAHMKIHKRLHTGEKPYECPFCKKCFTYKTRWRIHLRMHTGELPFVCSVCNNSYYDKGSLRKHQKKKNHMSEEDTKMLIKI